MPRTHNDDNCGSIREELDHLVVSATSNGVNLEKVLWVVSVLLLIFRAIHITTETLFLKYFFGGRYGLLSSNARAVFKAYHMKDLNLMDRNNGTHIRKEIERSPEEYNSTWYCPVFLSALRFSIFMNTLSQGVISRQAIIFIFLMMRSCIFL